MTREHVMEMLPILKAYAEGKTIQVLFLDGIWHDIIDPEFGSTYSKYRIKPENKLVPFTYEDNLIGKLVIGKIASERVMITGQTLEHAFLCGNETCSYKYLFANFVFEDGYPCGKEIEE
jgi:hypothetical protein